MKFLNDYEFITEARKLFVKIKEESLDNLVYLTDKGYTVYCKDGLRWIEVYISKDSSNTWHLFSDIKSDIISYMDYMNEKYDIQFIEFYGCKESNNDHTDRGLTKMFTKDDQPIEKIDDLNDFYFNTIKIAFNKKWKK